MIKVLFFANLRDLAGVEALELPIGSMAKVRDLLAVFQERLPNELVDALRDESAMVSINHQYAGWDAELPDGAEVGILPPVSGG